MEREGREGREGEKGTARERGERERERGTGRQMNKGIDRETDTPG